MDFKFHACAMSIERPLAIDRARLLVVRSVARAWRIF
jgi:hypothetical protein